MKGYIEIVAGTLGGGKSMAAVERAYYHLLAGGWVYTNIELHAGAIRGQMVRHRRVFRDERLVFLEGRSVSGFHMQIARGTVQSQVLVMIDEAHLEWNSRDYQSTKSDPSGREMLNFITLVRKLDIILIFITQSPEDIDKQMRKKASWLLMCRNLKDLRLFGFIPLFVPLFVRTRYDIAVGGNKPRKVSSEWFFRPKWVCELYNSDALLGAAAGKFSGMRVVEAAPLERLPPGPEQVFRFDAFLVILGAVCGAFFF